MKKLLTTLIALAFVGFASGAVFAMKHEGPKNDKLAAACKDKKPGETVKVDDKEMKCPEPKKEKK